MSTESVRSASLIPEFGTLSGVRVLSSGNIIAAPYAAGLMAEMGAEVIHLERPGVGDTARAVPGEFGVNSFWAAQARNRLSMTLELDMNNEKSKEIFLGLIRQSDIWVESLVWLEKLGINDEMIMEANPQIVIVHVSGYGKKEFGGIPEVCDRPSFDIIGQAFSGYLSLTGVDGGDFSPGKPMLDDYLTSYYAVFGALSAYIRRLKTGKGEIVDLAQYEAASYIMNREFVEYQYSKRLPPRTGTRSDSQPYGVYQAGDGRYVAVGTVGPSTYYRALKVMGLDTDYFDFISCGASYTATQSPKGKELAAKIDEWMRSHTAQEVEDLYNKTKTPAAVVNTVADCLTHPHFLSRDNFVTYIDDNSGKEVTSFDVIPKMKNNPGKVWRGGPKLGQDTENILRTILGFSDEKIAGLHADKII
ncbi:CoA transferase [Dehalobacter sp. DCM]|uniref:CaiB/BaiF CoA transferase family protein n=1 Tax=Dehalobacter sp. DCM TaxID=2907827 RepID=UPI00308217DC|nr:CoA transferase [Dehalobacter sp. DCM]